MFTTNSCANEDTVLIDETLKKVFHAVYKEVNFLRIPRKVKI